MVPVSVNFFDENSLMAIVVVINEVANVKKATVVEHVMVVVGINENIVIVDMGYGVTIGGNDMITVDSDVMVKIELAAGERVIMRERASNPCSACMCFGVVNVQDCRTVYGYSNSLQSCIRSDKVDVAVL